MFAALQFIVTVYIHIYFRGMLCQIHIYMLDLNELINNNYAGQIKGVKGWGPLNYSLCCRGQHALTGEVENHPFLWPGCNQLTPPSKNQANLIANGNNT